MHWIEKPGTSLEAMRRITVNVSKELRSVPEVRNFGSHIGRAEVADEVVGPNFTELWISVDPKADHAQPQENREDRRRLSRHLPGRADLPEGTHQRGVDRRRGHGRGADLRSRYGRPPRQGARDRQRDGADRRGDEPEGRAAAARPAARRAASSRGVGTARLDRRRRPPRGNDAGQGVEGRRAVPRPEDLRRLRLGRRRHSQRHLEGELSCRSRRRWARTSRLSDAAEIALVPAPNEIKREGASRQDRRDLQRAGARPGKRRPRDRKTGRGARFRARIPSRVPRRIRRPRGVAVDV